MCETRIRLRVFRTLLLDHVSCFPWFDHVSSSLREVIRICSCFLSFIRARIVMLRCDTRLSPQIVVPHFYKIFRLSEDPAAMDSRLNCGLLWLAVIPGMPLLVLLLRGILNRIPFAEHPSQMCPSSGEWLCLPRYRCSTSRFKGCEDFPFTFLFTHLLFPGSKAHRNRASRKTSCVHHWL